MGRKILVVDDEAVLVETIAYNLEQAGYQVITAADGASGLEVARRESPDLVILDIMLPEMDGLEVCRQLRRESVQRRRLAASNPNSKASSASTRNTTAAATPSLTIAMSITAMRHAARYR